MEKNEKNDGTVSASGRKTGGKQRGVETWGSRLFMCSALDRASGLLNKSERRLYDTMR